MTRDETKKLLMIIDASFPQFKIDDLTATLNAWSLVLESYQFADMQEALVAFITTDDKGFAPSIGQLISMSRKLHPTEQLEKTALDMWAEYVYPAIQDSTYHSQERFNKMPPMVQKAVGTASQLKHWAIDEDFNMGVAQSQFVRSYNTWLEREKELQRMPRNIRPESVLEMKPIEYAIEDKSFEIEEGVEAPENLQERILSTFAN